MPDAFELLGIEGIRQDTGPGSSSGLLFSVRLGLVLQGEQYFLKENIPHPTKKQTQTIKTCCRKSINALKAAACSPEKGWFAFSCLCCIPGLSACSGPWLGKGVRLPRKQFPLKSSFLCRRTWPWWPPCCAWRTITATSKRVNTC